MDITQLRLILGAVGGAFIIGLWWWERRRGTLASDDPSIRPVERIHERTERIHERIHERQEPRFDARETSYSDTDPEAPEAAAPVSVMRAALAERPIPSADPPLVTINDLPDDLSEVVLATPQRTTEVPSVAEPDPSASPWVASADLRARERVVRHVERSEPPQAPSAPPIPAFIAANPDDESAPTYHADGLPVPPALVMPAVADVQLADAPLEQAVVTEEVVAAPVAAAPAARAEVSPRQQRIVSIRLMARERGRIEGSTLRAGLEREGIQFGRYAIFHRQFEDAGTLYSVASLVEPGTFDLATMDAISVPGVTFFAVFPGPLPAPQCFDDLMATARRLADRLGGVLYDDAGMRLTGQRVLGLREELVHFERLAALSRQRPRV